MNDMTLQSCRDFAAALASAAPTPGGGGAAALTGALAAALGSMVANLTIGKPKFAAAEPMLCTLRARCDALRERLLALVAADAEGFAPLAAAYRLPKDAPNRAAILETATRAACEPPLAMVTACGEVIEAAEVLAKEGSPLAVSDAGCAAALAVGAMRSAALNVYINTGSLQDRTAAETLNAQVRALLEQYVPRGNAVTETVARSLGA